ncbi:MAG: GNAT family N-acetyltransferase [Nocardioidaceae bacterium]
MAEKVHLRDGTKGWVWPLLPTDRNALVQEFETLSPESRRRRFLGPVVHLSDAMLKHLVDEVDGVDHVALVLMAEVGEDVVPTGIARCVRYPHEPEAADIAVTVKDDWQGRGVATALLKVLMKKRPAGVTHLLTEVAADNPASLAMLRHLGPTRTYDTGMGILDVEVDLVNTGQTIAEEPGERLHEVLTDPRRARLRARDLVCPWLRMTPEEAAAVDVPEPGEEPGDTEPQASEA